MSILGTWQGDASESWEYVLFSQLDTLTTDHTSPKRSSLLQVFVSISGLVLVRNPYLCEPAYAKLENTDEGRVQAFVALRI